MHASSKARRVLRKSITGLTERERQYKPNKTHLHRGGTNG